MTQWCGEQGVCMNCELTRYWRLSSAAQGVQKLPTPNIASTCDQGADKRRPTSQWCAAGDVKIVPIPSSPPRSPLPVPPQRPSCSLGKHPAQQCEHSFASPPSPPLTLTFHCIKHPPCPPASSTSASSSLQASCLLPLPSPVSSAPACSPSLTRFSAPPALLGSIQPSNVNCPPVTPSSPLPSATHAAPPFSPFPLPSLPLHSSGSVPTLPAWETSSPAIHIHSPQRPASVPFPTILSPSPPPLRSRSPPTLTHKVQRPPCPLGEHPAQRCEDSAVGEVVGEADDEVKCGEAPH